MLFCLLENSRKDTIGWVSRELGDLIGWVSRELGDLILNHLEKKKPIHNEEDLLISATGTMSLYLCWWVCCVPQNRGACVLPSS